jgi:hypothetical protein
MITQGTVPVSWNMEKLKNLKYEFGLFTPEAPIEAYTSVGHDPYRMSVWMYHYPKIMPAGVDTINQHWPELSNVGIAVNLARPGQYLPWHQDRYSRYRKVNNLTASDKIIRIIVMAEDSQPGQIFHIKDRIWGDWKAGEWFAWSGADWHASYNLSTVDRYVIQITGTIDQ